MDLHTKILATLWILAVVLIGVRLFCNWIEGRHKYTEWRSKAARFGLQLVEWPSNMAAVVAVLDAVVYGLMWVWR